MEQRNAIVEGSAAVLARPPAGLAASPWVQLLRSLGPARILALGAVAAVMLGFFAYVIARAAEDRYTLLFSGLALTDAQELVGRLDAMGVPYRLSAAGAARHELHAARPVQEPPQPLPGGPLVVGNQCANRLHGELPITALPES